MKASEAEHGFDMAKVRERLDGEDWEDDIHGDGSQVRRLYLGSVFSLTPSGKYYMPFACSNVMGCDTCKGTCYVQARLYKRRTQKKHSARHVATQRLWERRWGALTGLWGRELNAHEARAKAWLTSQPKAFRLRGFMPGSVCTACCDTSGSREAHLDEMWRLSAEAAFEAIGLSIEVGEGDPCDLFAVEYRDNPDQEDEDDDGGLCPICGERVTLTGKTTDGRLIGSCGDAFTQARWDEDDDGCLDPAGSGDTYGSDMAD
jgi:hypothetical protein